jgi:tRNA-dihydrouridine synthase
MKKHYKAYVGGWPGAAEFRAVLMAQDTPEAVEAEVQKYLASHS